MTTPIQIRPVRSLFHRPSGAEMSGALPSVLYKILSPKFAASLVDQGEMMWSTMTWFQHLEDAARGDKFEGTRRYFPINGLQVNRIEPRNARPDNAVTVLPEHGFVSRATQSARIFIYSMTIDPTLIIDDSSDRACVEIFDPPEFLRRVGACIRRHQKEAAATLFHDAVSYWTDASPPENVWALPHRLTMHKHECHKRHREYRFAFGVEVDAFDFEHVDCFIVDKDTRWPRDDPKEKYHRKKLRLGSLHECCRLCED